MKKLVLFSVLLTLSIKGIGQTDDKKKVDIRLSANFFHGLIYDGRIQVREHGYEGTPFGLRKNLGMDKWIFGGGSLALDLREKNIVEFAYSNHFFEGTKQLPDTAWYNGTHYQENAKADISNTIFKSYEWVWKARIFKTERINLYLRTAILYEKLKFYIDAPVDTSSPIVETFEKFWKQQQPLPTIGLAAHYKLSSRLQLRTEIAATYLPKIKTWMNEGGTIYLSQSNFDGQLGFEYRYKFLAAGAGVWFKHFKLIEESTEDHNRFLINGCGYKVNLVFII